jgi:hypothetical protein
MKLYLNLVSGQGPDTGNYGMSLFGKDNSEDQSQPPKLHWERLHVKIGEPGACRAEVPGGWLVTIIADPSAGLSQKFSGVTFLPDPGHTWNVKCL